MRRCNLVCAFLCSSVVAGFTGVTWAAEAGTPPAPPARPAPVPRASLAEAQQMLAASQAAAVRLGVAVSCAVVDVRGDLVALARMDGANFYTADVARGKAVASALLGQPSGALPPDRLPIFHSLAGIARIDLLPVQGALPLIRNGQTLGAIGCSGASSQQDEDAARAGMQTFR